MEMVDSTFDLNFIWNTFSVLANLAVLGICVYYIIVKPGIDSILLVIGSFIHLLTTLFYSVLLPIISRTSVTDMYSRGWLLNIVSAIALIGTICFTAGLIVLIVNQVNSYKKLKSLG